VDSEVSQGGNFAPRILAIITSPGMIEMQYSFHSRCC
jgi:hypothetical protein